MEPTRSNALIEPEALGRAVRGERRPLPIAYGWVVVAAVTTILTVTSGARLLFGVVLKPVADDFGWDRASLAAAVTVGMVVLAACQPLVGLLVDRVGSTRVLIGGTVLLGAALVPLSFATRLWQVYLLYGVVISLAFAATSPVNATALVGRWFEERRGAALAIATSGSAFGQLLIVPLGAWILSLTDWQTAYRLVAVLLLVVMVPLGLLTLRDAPSGAAPLDRRESGDGLGLGAAARTPAFWLLAFGFVACGFTMAFPNTHFIAYADDMGMGTLHAARAIGITALFSIGGSLLLGIAADHYRRPAVLAVTYGLRGAAFLLLLLVGRDLLFVYAVVLGISWTATTPLTAAIAADLYGRASLGTVFGTLFTFMNLGFGLGAFVDGAIYELAGGYDLALGLNAALGFVAAVGVLAVPARLNARTKLADRREGLGVPVSGAAGGSD